MNQPACSSAAEPAATHHNLQGPYAAQPGYSWGKAAAVGVGSADETLVVTTGLGHGNDESIADRIAACLNYCEGVATDQLKASHGLISFRETALGVVRSWERGDLAGAVGALEADCEVIGGISGDA